MEYNFISKNKMRSRRELNARKETKRKKCCVCVLIVNSIIFCEQEIKPKMSNYVLQHLTVKIDPNIFSNLTDLETAWKCRTWWGKMIEMRDPYQLYYEILISANFTNSLIIMP